MAEDPQAILRADALKRSAQAVNAASARAEASAPVVLGESPPEVSVEPAGSGYKRRDIALNIDEPLAVGAEGITREEAMRRAKDLGNRQLLDELTNQATKGARQEVPIIKRAPLPPTSVAENPSALVTRPELRGIKEWDELSEIIMQEHGPKLGGKEPGEVKEILNRALREELQNPRTAPGQLIANALRIQFGKDPKHLFHSVGRARLPWGALKGLKGPAALVTGLAAVASAEATAAELDLDVPTASHGENLPPTIEDIAAAQLKVATAVGEVSSSAPGGLLAALFSLGKAAPDAVKDIRALQMAEVNNVRDFSGRLKRIQNKPWMIEPSSGKVYAIDMGDDDPMRKGELTLLKQFSRGFGAGNDFFFSGRDALYRAGNDRWYFGEWGR